MVDWNITISQALPGRSVFEISYVANKSTNELINGSNGGIDNINNVYPGGFFLPDPVLYSPLPGREVPAYVSPAPPTCTNGTTANNSMFCFSNPIYAFEEAGANGNGFSPNHFHPLKNYTNVDIDHARELRELQLAATLVAKAVWPADFPDELHLQQGSGHSRWTNRQRNRQRRRCRSLQHQEQLRSAGVRPHPHPERFGGVAGSQVHSRQQIPWWCGEWLATLYLHNLPKRIPAANHDEWKHERRMARASPCHSKGAPDLPNNSIILPNGTVSTAVSGPTWFGTNAGQQRRPSLAVGHLRSTASRLRCLL